MAQSARTDETATDLNETGRIEAFSDGVFAIAITLLVLDLRLPGDTSELSNEKLGEALGNLWPTYLAFGISFAFIGIMWINHHRLFSHIARADNNLLIYNLLLLLGVTLVPFPTALVADHLGHPGEYVTTQIYSGLFVGIAVFFNLLWRHAATDNRLLNPNADSESVARITRQYMFGPILYLIAFGLAFVSPELSLLLSLLLALFFALPPPPLEMRAPSQLL